MRFSQGTVEGLFLIDLETIEDHRGWFARAWCDDEFKEQGLSASWKQSNVQFSPAPGTLRGIHFQRAPHEEVKLVRCTSGSVFDVAIDLRPGSPTYQQWHGVELSAEMRNAVWVPKGCAHGYVTLEANSEVFYLTSQEYKPESVGSIRHDDPQFGIEWPVEVRVLPAGLEQWALYKDQEETGEDGK